MYGTQDPPQYSKFDEATANPVCRPAEYVPAATAPVADGFNRNATVVQISTAPPPVLPVNAQLSEIDHLRTIVVKDHLCLSVMSLLLFGLPFSIIALVFSLLTREAKQRWDTKRKCYILL